MFPILSRNQIKFIRSLKQKKYRYKFKKYIVEGEKLISDLVKYRPESIDYIVMMTEVSSFSFPDSINIFKAEPQVFRELTSMVQPQGILAVCLIPEEYFNGKGENTDFGLYFDGVQDPGNVGTMLRAADWYGVKHILIGPGTADPFSPKVVQAAMGSHCYLDLYECSHESLSSLSGPVLLADMDGEDAYDYDWPAAGLLVMGNEGQGISPVLARMATDRITLPSARGAHTESLNVSMACTSLLTLRHQYFRNQPR